MPGGAGKEVARVAEVDIGMGKTARQGYSLSDVAIVPSRRTRDPADVDVAWEIDAYHFDIPILASPCDSVTSPATAVQLGQLGAGGVLHLEGLWARYDDPAPLYDEIAALPHEHATRRLQEIYAEPVDPELIGQRIAEVKAAGITCAVAVTPQRTLELAEAVLRAEPDLLVIQATVVSAEHVSRTTDALNLKDFIRHYEIPVVVGGCTSYQSALHLMRTGAAGVLVGSGSGVGSTIRDVLGVGMPLATALADARAARMRHLDETGVYVHVIADGGMSTGGDIAKAIVCGADAVMIGTPLAAAHEAPGKGWHWSFGAVHASLPRGPRVRVEPRGSFEEILLGPSHEPDGRVNLVGALRRTMALSGYDTLKQLQKAELTIAGDRR
jgi:IMP dehydrogenase